MNATEAKSAIRELVNTMPIGWKKVREIMTGGKPHFWVHHPGTCDLRRVWVVWNRQLEEWTVKREAYHNNELHGTFPTAKKALKHAESLINAPWPITA